MKTRYYSIVIFFLMFLTHKEFYSQEYYTQNMGKISVDSLSFVNKEDGDSVRNVFIYSSVGVREILAFGVGYQVSPKLAFSVKWSGSFTGGSGGSAAGLGAKISYYPHLHLPSVIFNCINFEAILYYELSVSQQPPPLIKGGFIDLGLGKEIIAKEGLRVFYGVGLYRSVAIGAPALFSLSIKLGINYNFF